MTTFTRVSESMKTKRIESIDLLRGIVMIIMALDHVRDYFHADAFLYNPVDLAKTNAPLFFTRWITHFCAPVFVFLSGTSAFLVGTRKGKNELSSFLFKRGVWLIVLEFTVINFSWFFNVEFTFIALTVIWGLAMGMIILSVASRLPLKIIFTIGLLLVVGHNLLDTINFGGEAGSVWAVFHEPRIFNLGRFTIFTGYPILPWTGIMLLGYCFGKLYQSDVEPHTRRKILLQIGAGMIAIFVVVRAINIYGDPSPWSAQPSGLFTFLSFINLTKYPPSFLYIFITLGPAMIFLAFAENFTSRLWQNVIALGRVPLFYYVIHIFVIHILALIAALATGFGLSDMVFNQWITDSPNLKGYGFNLDVTYVIWIVIVLALFPLCLWYDRYKSNHREKWWLSYL